jgi:zinc D-Ala-D-Ala carboxypeptidase
MTPDTQLTPHFRLSEFLLSQAATRLGLRNEPFTAEQENLRRLALVLEEVRHALGGHPVVISSGFRSFVVNNAVGGSVKSAHLTGRAADFTVPGFGTPRQVCQRIVDAGVIFDQLIDERGWVHLGIAARNAEPRREVLTAFFQPGAPTKYSKGLL